MPSLYCTRVLIGSQCNSINANVRVLVTLDYRQVTLLLRCSGTMDMHGRAARSALQ